MIKKCLGLIVGLLLLTGCSQFALLSSGAGIAMTNNAYVKVYNGIDLATTITTKKDIKTHAYHYVKATIEKSKEINEYIFQTVSYPITINKSFDGSVENKIIYAPDYVLMNAVDTYLNQPINNDKELDWFIDETMFRLIN